MNDLTLSSFAYLKLPLLLAAVAFITGALGCWVLPPHARWAALAIMMIMFFQAARLALVVFDPYLSSRPLAAALLKSPPGKLIIDGAYYPFSSVFFYADRDALLWNGRFNNLEYGSLAPDAPNVFIDDAQARKLWLSPEHWYILASEDDFDHIMQVFAGLEFHTVLKSGGKALYTNRAIE